MDERMRFVIRLKDGETMASLCREFGISRKTGYKIFERYQQCGLEGLSDRARRPFRYANQLPESVEAAMGWSSPWGRAAIGRKARPCPMACFPMISGAPITRKSFSSAIDAIVIR